MKESSTPAPLRQKSSVNKNNREKKKHTHHVSESPARTGRIRSYILAGMSILIAFILIFRLYTLQIIKGESYQEQFQSRIRRTVVVRAKRGTIRDRNGKALAETVPTYNITMNDLTDDTSEDNALLNSRIQEIIRIVDENDEKDVRDSMASDFQINLVGGSFYYREDLGQTARNRFLADVYGYGDPADMPQEYQSKSAEDVMNDLADRFGISSEASGNDERQNLLKMVIARYKLSLNYYQKYISTVLAKDVSDNTIHQIEAQFNSDEDGIQIEEQLVRRYYDAEFFSNIIGYRRRSSAAAAVRTPSMLIISAVLPKTQSVRKNFPRNRNPIPRSKAVTSRSPLTEISRSPATGSLKRTFATLSWLSSLTLSMIR